MSLHLSVATRVLQTTLKITVSCHDAYPSIHVALKITVVSCWTHQQLFRQQLAPWSVTSEVSTPDPSFRVDFLRSNQHNYLWKTQHQRAQQEKKCITWSYCRWYSAQFTHKIRGTVESSFYMLRSTHRLFRNVHDVRLHTSRIGHHNVPSSIFTWYVLKIVTFVIMQSKSRCFFTFDGGDFVCSVKSHLSPSVSRAGRDDFGHPPSEDTLSRRWNIQSCLLFSTMLDTMKPNLQCPLIDTVRTAFVGPRIVLGGSNATKHTAFRYVFIVVLCEAPRDTVLASFTVSISSRKLRDVPSF